MSRTMTAALSLTFALYASAAEVIKRGAAISPDTRAISVATLLEKPGDFSTEPVVVDGTIATSCTRKGCWMQLAPKEGEPGVRVTFKDYGFFIPLDAKGMQARAEGVAVVKTLSKAEADHLEEEGARLTRNADGSAFEVSFVAAGVELRR